MFLFALRIRILQLVPKKAAPKRGACDKKDSRIEAVRINFKQKDGSHISD